MTPNLFDRLARDTRLVLESAHLIAEDMNCHEIDIPQIIEALLTSNGTVAYRILEDCGIDFVAALARLRETPQEHSGRDTADDLRTDGITRRTLQLLEDARIEADSNEDITIGTEYILLALLSSGEPEAGLVFDSSMVSSSAVWDRLRLLETEPGVATYDSEDAFAIRIAESVVWQNEVSKNRVVLIRLKEFAQRAPSSEVIRAVREAIEKDPLNYALRISVAEMLREHGEFYEAHLHLGTAVTINVTNPIAYRRMARVAVLMNQRPLAERILETGWKYFVVGSPRDHRAQDRQFWFSLLEQ